MENKELNRKTAEELDKELRKEELADVAGGMIGSTPTSAAEEESEMEKTTRDMGGIGSYGNRFKR